MRTSLGNQEVPLARPADLQLSKVVAPAPQPLVDDRFGDLRYTINDLPFAPDDPDPEDAGPARAAIGKPAGRPAKAWVEWVLDSSTTIRKAFLATSIVVLVGLAFLAAAQTAP